MLCGFGPESRGSHWTRAPASCGVDLTGDACRDVAKEESSGMWKASGRRGGSHPMSCGLWGSGRRFPDCALGDPRPAPRGVAAAKLFLLPVHLDFSQIFILLTCSIVSTAEEGGGPARWGGRQAPH